MMALPDLKLPYAGGVLGETRETWYGFAMRDNLPARIVWSASMSGSDAPPKYTVVVIAPAMRMGTAKEIADQTREALETHRQAHS